MQIQKGPCPPEFFKKATPTKYRFGEMDVGNWFLVDSIEEAERAQNAAYSYGRRKSNGFKLSMSKSNDKYCLKRVS
jgi:hypothetical protein